VFVRPGTNNGLHGSAFGFWTTDQLATRNPFSPAGNPDPTQRFWQFGATAGGAVIPDRMFLFGSYEGTRRRGNNLQFGTVPTAELRAGDFSAFGTIYNPATGISTGTNVGTGRVPFPNNRIPAGQVNPAAQAILGYLPLPNQPGLSNNLVTNVPFKNDGNVLDGRLDYRFTDLISGFLRYGFSDFNANEGSIFGPVVGNASGSGLRNHHATASLIGSRHGIIGEFRLGYNRYRNALTPQTQTDLLNQQLGTTNFGGTLPSINITGLGALGTPAYLPSKAIDNTYNGVANFYTNRGRHQIRWGVDIRRLHSDGFQNQLFGPNGTFFFGPGTTSLSGVTTTPAANSAFANSFAAFLLGAPTSSGAFTFSDVPSYRQTWYSGFLSDTFRLTSRIALDLGLRYDVYSPVQTRRAGNNSFFDPATGTLTFAGVGGVDASGNQDWDLNNVAPRIGIAIRPAERTVVRASYSMSYFPVPFSLMGINQTGTGIQQGINGGFGAAPGGFTSPVLPSATAPANGAVAPNIPFSVSSLVTPYVHSYFFMIQQDLTQGFLIDAAYVGNTAHQLPFMRELNAAAPGTGLAGLPFGTGRTASVTEVASGLNSNFNSLQINLTKRFSSGVSFAGAYTFGKALDYSTNLVDPFNRRANYGPADWDHRHMLTLSHVLDLPFGNGTKRWNTGALGQILANWQLNGIFRWTTGAPYTVYADPLTCACPGLAAIPANLVGATTNINGQTTLNPSDFAVPAGSFGSQGRNGIRGPESHVYNMSLFKSFQVREQMKMELRGEVYNLANSTQFGTPVANLGAGNFGTPTAIVNSGGRQFQIGARFLF
jgi:hypothetical protein